MAEELESLSSILGESASSKGEPAKADPAPPAAEPKAQTPAATEPKSEVEAKTTEQARDEAGRFASKAEPAKEAPTRADIAAIIDERRKRQELERKVQELQSGKQKPDFWDNPEAALDARVNELVNPLQSQNLQLQVELARLQNPDFDEVMMVFLKAAQENEVLKAQADNSPNPLKFIYQEGKRLKELGPYGGDLAKRDEAKFGELKGEIAKRDEQLKALQTELETLKKSQAELAAVPRSLNAEQSGTPKAADADPDDLRKIVRFK